MVNRHHEAATGGQADLSTRHIAERNFGSGDGDGTDGCRA